MLYLVLIILFGYFIAKLLRPHLRHHAPYNKDDNIQELVQCANCDIYLVKTEAIAYKGHFLCSKNCKEMFKRHRR